MEANQIFLLISLAAIGSIPMFFPKIVNKFFAWLYRIFRYAKFIPKGVAPFYAREIYIRIFGGLWLSLLFWALYMIVTGTMPKQI